MNRKKRICVVTGSRADYGLLYWVMKEIEKSQNLQLLTIATGAHLLNKFGYTVREILKDGFANVRRIKIDVADTSAYGIAKSIGSVTGKLAGFFKKNKVDCLVLLGDRFEMLAAAMAALPYNIPIAHIGGGEISEGVIDDNIRHSLTKLSHLHFAITEKCADRIKQMGEEPWRIKVVGSPRLDFIGMVRYKTKEELSKRHGIRFNNKVGLIVFHPTTLELKDTQKQIDNLLKALESIEIEKVVFYPNLDTNSDVIIDKIEKSAKKNKNIRLFKPLERHDYLSLLNAVDIVIGNSSIGVIEAPSFKLPAVNIGNRQRGRDCVGNIINADYSCRGIVNAIKKGLYDRGFLKNLKKIKNPYGDGKASRRIVDILSSIDFDNFQILKKNCFS